MNKQIWRVFILTGMLMILSAAGICVWNAGEDRRAGEYAGQMLADLKKTIPEEPQVSLPYEPLTGKDAVLPEIIPAKASESENLSAEQPDYCGYISIPAIGIELPVRQNWSEAELKLSPCRYSGSLDTNDLIIAAHNYRSQFGKLRSLSPGDLIEMTDLYGGKHRFTVSEIEIVEGDHIEQMMQGGGEQWSLTLFTCTLNGQSRVTVRAERDL